MTKPSKPNAKVSRDRADDGGQRPRHTTSTVWGASKSEAHLWSLAFRSGDPAQTHTAIYAAAEVEALGYGTIWLGSSPPVEFAGPVLGLHRAGHRGHQRHPDLGP